MSDMSQASEELRSRLDQFGWRLLIEEAPDREGKLDVVHDGRTGEQRGAPERNSEAAANGVVEMFAPLQLDLRSKPSGDAKREPLVGAVIAASWPRRLEPGDLRWAIRHPVRWDVIGRFVATGSVGRCNRAELRSCHLYLSTGSAR